MTDWVAISSLATAGATLVVAVSTFASVRSSSRSVRVAEESLRVGTSPLLMPSRAEDPPVKVTFADRHHVLTPGASGTVEATDEAIYLTMSVRNVGSGLAVLHGWRVELSWESAQERPELAGFRVLTRDLYVASGDVAFWQGTYRETSEPEVAAVREIVATGDRLVVDLLYGDYQGGQRVISRFSLLPRDDGTWMATVVKHWNVDRPNPR